MRRRTPAPVHQSGAGTTATTPAAKRGGRDPEGDTPAKGNGDVGWFDSTPLTMTTDIIQQAADVMRTQVDAPLDHLQWAARALADAGLLVTPEELALRKIRADNPYPHIDVDAAFKRIALERAVLDAADKWREWRAGLCFGPEAPLRDAVDALRATTPIATTPKDTP